MSSPADLQLNFASDGPAFRGAKAPGRNKHSKTFKKRHQVQPSCQLPGLVQAQHRASKALSLQLQREDRSRRPKILKGSSRTAEASAGSLKGYQLGPEPEEEGFARKKARLNPKSPDREPGGTAQATSTQKVSAEAEETLPALAGQSRLWQTFVRIRPSII